MRHYCLILIAFLLTLTAPAAKAQPDDADALDMTLSQNLESPEVAKRAKEYVRTHIDQLRRSLVKKGLEVKSLRDGEVLQITIPCQDLFGIGSTELKPRGLDLLRGLSMVVREPGRYKVLVAVHTDDTGDEQYADSISAARANAIDDGLWQIAGEKDTNVIPYGIGKDEPVASNTTRENRARNRRVEIYIVPDNALLEMAGMKVKR